MKPIIMTLAKSEHNQRIVASDILREAMIEIAGDFDMVLPDHLFKDFFRNNRFGWTVVSIDEFHLIKATAHGLLKDKR